MARAKKKLADPAPGAESVGEPEASAEEGVRGEADSAAADEQQEQDESGAADVVHESEASTASADAAIADEPALTPAEVKTVAAEAARASLQASAPPEPRDPPPMSLVEVAHNIAVGAGFKNPQEVCVIVDEQALSPEERAKARYHRRADESLCQAIESHPSFIAALEASRTAA